MSSKRAKAMGTDDIKKDLARTAREMTRAAKVGRRTTPKPPVRKADPVKRATRQTAKRPPSPRNARGR
jgi:hypothetical protein